MGSKSWRRPIAPHCPRSGGVPGPRLHRPCCRPYGRGAGLGSGSEAHGGRGLPARGRADAPFQHGVTAVLALDQGTTGATAIVVDEAGARNSEGVRAGGHEKLIRERTGLVIDAYFSGTKIRWILDQVPGAQKRAEAGELVCGTIDTWLIWKLTGGRIFATDVSNASRTLVFDIHRGTWDADLLGLLGMPPSMMAMTVPSSGVVAEADAAHFGARVPIAGIAGDQQAALFGQTCFAAGEAKNTYGTGCFQI